MDAPFVMDAPFEADEIVDAGAPFEAGGLVSSWFSAGMGGNDRVNRFRR
jgi:hypothetical protein